MSVYHALLHLWFRVGQSEAALRSLSAIFGAATVPVVYLLGAKLSSRFVGLCAALLFSVNAYHVQWSQELRAYSLVVFLVACSSLFFIAAIERPSWRKWLLYVLTSALAAYAHLFAGLVLAAHALSVLFLPGRKRRLLPAFLSYASIGILTAPLLVLFYYRARDPFNPLDWMVRPGFHEVVEVFHRLSGHAELVGNNGGRLLLIAYFVLCIAAVFLKLKNRPHVGQRGYFWPCAFLVLWLFLPVTMLLVLSLRQPVLLPRYLLISLPALVIFASEGIAAFRATWFRAAIVVVLITLAGMQLFDYYQARSRQDYWRTASAYVLAHGQRGDAAIFFVAPGRLLFDYYSASSPDRKIDIAYPEFAKEVSPHDMDFMPPLKQSRLASIAVGHDRVWLVLYHDQWPSTKGPGQNIQTQLSSRLPSIEEKVFGDVRVLLFSPSMQRPNTGSGK